MKKNRILILLTVLLGILAVYFLFQNDKSSFKKELRDFAVKDTAAISKIFMADRNGNSITLDRLKDGNWQVNGKFAARKDLLQSLMTAIYKVDVKENVTRSAYNNIIKTLSTSGVKCEIYLHSEDKPFKVYYVGGSTQDVLGTYMMLENSSAPFITEIPGFNGYLTPRYCLTLNDWKDPVLFKYSPDEIQKIQISYAKFPERNLVLNRNGEKFQVMAKAGEPGISRVDSVAVDNYLELYRNLYYESQESNLNNSQHDSLKQTTPLCTIGVTDIKGNSRSLIIFPMPLNEKSLTQQDSLGIPLKYDVDRMIGFLENEGEWVVIQHYTFDRIFRSSFDFDLDRRKQMKR